MSRVFAAAPLDDLHLAEQADPYVRALAGQLAGPEQLRAWTRKYGVELASQVMYRSILAASPHREFIETIEAQNIAPDTRPVRGALVIVPAMHYRERPELGGNGEYLAGIARRFGLVPHIVPLHSRGSLSANASLVAESLERLSDGPLWVMSVSKGSNDFRLAMQRYATQLKSLPLRAWVNICGPVHGARAADQFLASLPGRILWRMLGALYGVPYSVLDEMRVGHDLWREPLVLNASTRVINVVGIPVASYVRKPLVARYRALSTLGPNDGITLTHDSIHLPGVIYPLWGHDHFLRSPQISLLLYRLFAYLRRSAEDDGESTRWHAAQHLSRAVT